MIPFTQFKQPHGIRVSRTVSRPKNIERLAWEFIDRGGRFEAEILTTGEVSLTACMVDGEADLAIEIVPNGPEVTAAVDRLVKTAWELSK